MSRTKPRASLLSDMDANQRHSSDLSEIIIGLTATFWAALFIFLLAGILVGCGPCRSACVDRSCSTSCVAVRW